MTPKEFSLAIVDDEDKARKQVFQKLTEVFSARQRNIRISSFSNTEAYRMSLNSGAFYDLTFLDIEMPGEDGIELAKSLMKEGKKNRIIYVSNREDLVFDSLETKPFGFVRKSHFAKDIDRVIDSYLEVLKDEGNNSYVLFSEGRHINLSIDEIIYVESQGKKQVFHIQGHEETYPTLSTIKEIKSDFDDKGFLECYKGILVNFRFIKIINDDYILLKTGARIPLARRKANDVRKEYMYLMQDRIQNIF